MTVFPLVAVPLPFVTALFAGLVATRLLSSAGGNQASRFFFSALFILFAAQAMLVGLRFGYDLDAILPVQRVLPLADGPLAFLGFRALTRSPQGLRRDIGFYGGTTLAVMVAGFAFPPFTAAIDVLIAISLIIYIVLMARIWRHGTDGFADAPLSNATDLHRWLLHTILLFIFVLIMDLLIAADFVLEAGHNATLFIVLGSLPLILFFVAMAFKGPLGKVDRRQPAPPVGAAAEDLKLAARAAEFLSETGLYRDPDLSLKRLARRLGVPARSLSVAINRTQGVNISQFVNDYRVRDAARRLAGGRDNIAEVMTAAGFLTRSNFYREFSRVHGMSPTEYSKRSLAANGNA